MHNLIAFFWHSFRVKYWQSEVKYLDRQIEKQLRIIRECNQIILRRQRAESLRA